MNRIPELGEIDVASHPVCVSPGGERLLLFVTAHRDDDNKAKVTYAAARLLTGLVETHQLFRELEKLGLVRMLGVYRAKHGGGVVVEVLPPFLPVQRVRNRRARR